MRGYSAIGLYNPKSPHNIGATLRALDCFESSLLLVQGKRYEVSATDTTKAFRRTPMIHVADLRLSIPYDCVPVAIEVIKGAQDLREYVHPQRALYIFGPEDGSLPRKVLGWCRDIVSVPTHVCMNLAACVNVVLYDRLFKEKSL